MLGVLEGWFVECGVKVRCWVLWGVFVGVVFVFVVGGGVIVWVVLCMCVDV